MELRQDIVPRTGGEQVGELSLLSLEEFSEAMANGEVSTCNMAYLAFFIRGHCYLNTENEPSFVEIFSRLHRYHDFVHCVRMLQPLLTGFHYVSKDVRNPTWNASATRNA